MFRHTNSAAVANKTDGSQTQIISFPTTARPRGEKKPAPIGDTAIGLNPKKYRVSSRGAKKATPNPPSVKASSSPCDAVARNRNNLIATRGRAGLARGRSSHATTNASTAANKSE